MYLVALAIMLQWPFSFYSGALTGLQKLVTLNGITAGMATLRNAGAILVVWLVSPTIEAFLVWQIIANALQSLVLAVVLRLYVPKVPAPARLHFDAVRHVWRFAAGMGSVSVVSMIIGVNLCTGLALTWRANASPSMRGMFTSQTIRFGLAALSFSAASWPSTASTTA